MLSLLDCLGISIAKADNFFALRKRVIVEEAHNEVHILVTVERWTIAKLLIDVIVCGPLRAFQVCFATDACVPSHKQEVEHMVCQI